MNNLQLLSSILHYNSCTKDETKLKPNHFIVTYHERKSKGGESLLCKLNSKTVWMTNIEYICNTYVLYIEIVMRIVSKAGSVMINTSPSPQR